MKKVLAINSGSSSFKYKLFELPSEKTLASGLADRIGLSGSTFEMALADGQEFKEEVEIKDQETAVQLLLTWFEDHHVTQIEDIVGVGHRIVNGAEEFPDSAIIDENNLHKIFDLTDYAPLHNPAEGRGIQAFMKLLPGVPQVGVFDTSFHQAMDKVHYLYSVPYDWYEKYQARKFGAHGTSVRYVASRASELIGKPLADLKMVVCHLGSGASITAVKDGKSFDTSMGFSPLAGITMSSRSGDVDPSLLQFIMKKEQISSMDEMVDILNHKSGMLGLSEISPDMRDIEKARKTNERADLTYKIFVNRIVRYIGAYLTEMGGLDALVFTAGIGEHDKNVRADVMKALHFLGLEPDLAANESNGEKFISKADSKIAALIIPTDEELMIERDVVRLAHLN